MEKWERITRRICILAQYGYTMDYFLKAMNEPNFMEDDWLTDYYGQSVADYIQAELDALDLLDGAKQS